MKARIIAYYISDYGYGHATRSIAVIRALLQEEWLYRIIICSSNRILSFMQASLLEQANVVYRQCASDLGYVLHTGRIGPDVPTFKMKYKEYVETFPIEVRREVDFLQLNEVDLVISDISPIAIMAANQVEVLSVGLSNFTWFTGYLSIIDRGNLQPLYKAYAGMDYFICLEGGSNEPEWGRKGVYKVGFFCREVDWGEVSRIRKEINPGNKKKIVYFGIGMSIDVHDLHQMKIWNDDSCLFVVSSNIRVSHPNVLSIPVSYTESQNYVAASDLVISKPGWSTVSEAVVMNKPLVLLQRSALREDINTIQALQLIHPCHLVEWEQLILSNMNDYKSEMNSYTFKPEGKNEVAHIIAYLKHINT